MKYSIVFTGTRQGMNADQHTAVMAVFANVERLYHGCCHGADTQAHELCRQMWDRHVWIEGYPSNPEQAQCGLSVDVMHGIMHPIQRNHLMVIEARAAGNPLVVATPFQRKEQFRGSGTWATMRWARKTKTPLIIAWPDGDVEHVGLAQPRLL